MSSLSTEDVLDRIEVAFGERPTTNAIWLASSRSRQQDADKPTAWRSSLTSGMPAPSGTGGDGQLLFDQDHIDTWIQRHPAMTLKRLEGELTPNEAAADRAAAIGRARAAGLSWVKIAQVIARVDERPVSRELVRRVFTPLID